jgi:hypothetical protein
VPFLQASAVQMSSWCCICGTGSLDILVDGYAQQATINKMRDGTPPVPRISLPEELMGGGGFRPSRFRS